MTWRELITFIVCVIAALVFAYLTFWVLNYTPGMFWQGVPAMLSMLASFFFALMAYLVIKYGE